MPSIINLENTRPNKGSTPPDADAIIEIVPVGAIQVVVAFLIPNFSICASSSFHCSSEILPADFPLYLLYKKFLPS